MESPAEISQYIDEIEIFMIKHGFTAEEADNLLIYWRANLSNIIFHQPESYWYYNFITISNPNEEHLEYKFHDKIYGNIDAINKSTIVGCITCDKICFKNEIKTYVNIPEEDCVETAVCSFCDKYTIVPHIYKKKSNEWFTKLLHQAHNFWIVEAKYKLIKR